MADSVKRTQPAATVFVQERNNAEFSIDPRHLDDITARKYRRVLHAEMINVNRYRKKRECQSPDFDLLSSFLLQIGDYLRPVAIHVNPDFSPRLSKGFCFEVEKGRHLRHNCVVET